MSLATAFAAAIPDGSDIDKADLRDLGEIIDQTYPVGKQLLADDTVLTIDISAVTGDPTATTGRIVVNAPTADLSGEAYFNTNSGVTQKQGTTGADFVVTGTTTVLTNGSGDGTDAKMNVSADNAGNLQIKNRSGSSQVVSWQILAWF